MRKAEREIKDRAEVEDILRRAQIVHLAMVDDGKPYVVPMNFGYADGALYMHCATEGRKIEVLRRNPSVCFAVHVDYEVLVNDDAACKSTSKYRSVIGCGRATLVTGAEAKVRGLDVIMGTFGEGPFEYSEAALERTLVIRVDVESMTGKRLGY